MPGNKGEMVKKVVLIVKIYLELFHKIFIFVFFVASPLKIYLILFTIKWPMDIICLI